MRKLGIAAFCAALGGCSSAITYIQDEYRGVPIVEVQMPDDSYRVFDKPSASRMMITSSLSSAVGQGLAAGITAGTAAGPPKPLFEAAAQQFLSESGRKNCRLIDTYLLARPQWEVKYDCTPAAPAAAPSASTKPKKPTVLARP